MNNICLKTFTHQILPISLIPFIAIIISYPLEYIAVQILHLLTLTSKTMPSGQSIGDNSIESPHLYIFRITREVLMSTYSSYVHFIATMMLLHVGLGTIIFVTRHLADKLGTSKGLKESQEDLKATLSHLRRNSIAKYQMLRLIQLEKTISYVTILLLQYSLVYCMCIIIVSSLPYSCFYTAQKPENLLTGNRTGRERSFTDMPHQLLVNHSYHARMENKYGDFRMLDAQETFDVVKVVGSIELNEDVYSLFQLNQTRLWLFCEQVIIPVDISDYTMPQMLSPINISIQEEDELMGYYVSPNGEFIIRSYSSGEVGSTYITKVSNPQTSIEFPKDFGGFSESLAFTSDGSGGYLVSSSDLYHFSTASGEIQKVLTLSEGHTNSITMSNDGKTLFLDVYQNGIGLTLQAINITDPASPNVLTNFELDLTANNVALSSDDKMIFVLTYDYLQILDVSDPKAIKEISSTAILRGRDILILSPDDKSLIIDFKYIVDVSDPLNLVINPSKILSSAEEAIFPLDNRAIFMLTETELQIVTVLSNYIPEQQLSYTSFNINIQDIPLNSSSFDVAVSPDGSIAYVACKEGLQILEIVNNTVLLYKERILETFSTKAILLSQDGKTAFVRTSDQILIVNLTEKTVLSHIDKPDFNIPHKSAFSPDGETIMISGVIINVANLTGPEQQALRLQQYIDKSDTMATNWEILVFSSDYMLYVYNISNIDSPHLIYEGILNIGGIILDIAISPDNQTLFINTYISSGNLDNLQIYNISDPANIVFLSTITISSDQDQSVLYLTIFPISSDTIMVSSVSNIVIIDVSDLLNPFILGLIPASSGGYYPMVVNRLSDFGTLTMFIADEYNKLKFATFKPQYIVEMPIHDVFYGEEFNNKLMLLKENTIERYTLALEGYRFTSFSLYNITLGLAVLTPVYTILPSWITFNKVNGVLRVQPTLQQSIGAYYTYYAISTQIALQEFDNIGDGAHSLDLVCTLLSLGYIDDERYLTSSFHPNKTLLLPAQYNSSEKFIRAVLTSHYFDGIQRFFVKSLLSLHPNITSISIVSPSQFSISVSLSLSEYSDSSIQRCQFVSQFPTGLMPTFQQNFTTIHLLGFLSEINDALANLIINLDDNLTPCDGTFTVLDGVNYPLTELVPDVSNYFQKNRAPTLKYPTKLQEEINNTPPLYTEIYFTIVVNKSVFNGDNINLELLTTDLGSWLTVAGLSLSGTPPEPSLPHFWPSTYQVTIRATSQYKYMDTSLTLTVHMSAVYYLKLALKVLSAIGLWVYLNSVFNILAKRLYKDPRNWILRTHEEVTPRKLFPVAFLGRELKETRLILTKMRTKVSKDLGLKSMNKKELAEYFINPTHAKLDMTKLFNTIESVVASLPASLKYHVEQYGPGVSSKKDLINQLVLNEIVMYQLSRKEEKQTKQAFERTKDRWTDLVQIDESQLWQFTINQAKLDYELETRGIYAESELQNEHMQGSAMNRPSLISRFSVSTNSKRNVMQSSFDQSSKDPNLTDTKGLKVELVSRSKNIIPNIDRSSQINLNLLQHALVAHAFKQQHLNIKTIFINVLSKEQLNKYACVPNFLASFLKLDLQPLLFSKGHKIGYGIKYKIIDDVLQFYGVVSRDIKNKKVIIQVMNKRGRILREIWIKGMEPDVEQESLITDSDITDKEIKTQNTTSIL